MLGRQPLATSFAAAALPLALALLGPPGCGSSSAAPSGQASGGTDGGDAAPASAPTLVTTKGGPVQGIVTGSTRVFYAIPFAAPPVGDLRWKPPAPAAPWTKPITASTSGPACPQDAGLTSSMFDPATSEDCLTLDVWAPLAESATPRPVMLWIFGGSFVIGSAGMKDYVGQQLSEATGAIVITINYRLGPFGFLGLQALHDEDPSHPSSGMYGIEDQRAAMAWAKDNVAAFGGDPKNVTIFGESAGGISVCTHLLSPPSKGLFQRAIIESGACASGISQTESSTYTQGQSLVKALGCDGLSTPSATLACMRATKTEQVIDALPTNPVNFLDGGVSWGTVVDGLNLPDDPTKLFKAGAFAHVPTLLGTNTDEGTLFFALSMPIPSDAKYQSLADGLFPGKGAAIVMHYPSSKYGSATAAAEVAVSDGGFTCPARRVARAMAGAGVPTFRYHFAHTPTNALLGGLGAFHSSEIPFVFGHASALEPNTPTAAETPLSAAMQGYWGRMAADGDPNGTGTGSGSGSGAVAWPKYDASTEPDLVLDLHIAAETAYKKADCDFWDALLGL
jgi:para-nitrobenzyl esterase